MHRRSLNMMKDFRDRYLADMKGCTVLDVGSTIVLDQGVSYRRLFGDYEYIGMDIVEGENVDIVGYENLADAYDVVISGQVMEHIERPWEWMQDLAELFRYYICIIAPNQSKEHRWPVDCYRFFPDGMRALFEYAGIVPLEIKAVKYDTIGIGTK